MHLPFITDLLPFGELYVFIQNDKTKTQQKKLYKNAKLIFYHA